MKKILFLLAICFGPVWFAKSAQPLSEKARFSLLTCGPGDDLYSIFGHTALRLRDDSLGWDLVFNYGTFDFSDDFYYKFAKGKLNYRLSIEPFESFYENYKWENRWVKEQELALNPLQRQALFNYLDSNYRPENRYYLYHFFFNNCSTLPLNVLENVLGTDFYVKTPEVAVDSSFRNLIDKYLVPQHWGDLGIDIGLGVSCDDICSPKQKTFIPDYLYQVMAISTLNGNPAVSRTEIILSNNPIQYGFSFTRPDVLFWAFLLIMILLSLSPLRKAMQVFDFAFFSILGLTGWLIIFLWFFTDHNGTQNNWNLVWALPLHFPLAIMVFTKGHARWFFWYMRSTAVLGIFALLGYFALPQTYNLDLIPLIILIIYRAVAISLRFRSFETQA